MESLVGLIPGSREREREREREEDYVQPLLKGYLLSPRLCFSPFILFRVFFGLVYVRVSSHTSSNIMLFRFVLVSSRQNLDFHSPDPRTNKPTPRWWWCYAQSRPVSSAQQFTLLLTIAQADNSPPAAPSPLASTAVSATAFGCSELLVLALRQTNDDVGFDGAEREDPQARAGTKRADGRGKWRGGVPVSLR